MRRSRYLPGPGRPLESLSPSCSSLINMWHLLSWEWHGFDPVIGVLRSRKSHLYPWLPFVLYLSLSTIVLSLFLGPGLRIVIAAIAASVAAILAEGFKTRYVDDDFLMLVVPLIVMALIIG